MLKNSKLQIFVLIVGLLLNFTLFAPKLRHKHGKRIWPSADNLKDINFKLPLATEAQLKQLVKGVGKTNKVSCPSCLQEVAGRHFRLHALRYHSEKALWKKYLHCCGVILSSGKKCPYSNLQSTNLSTHKKVAHSDREKDSVSTGFYLIPEDSSEAGEKLVVVNW